MNLGLFRLLIIATYMYGVAYTYMVNSDIGFHESLKL
jgi:hypothetical protein